jgi:predicted ABC-type ATPase
LVEAIRLADAVTVFDNSDLFGPRALVRIAGGAIAGSSLTAAEPLHRRIARCVAEALGVDVAAIFASEKRTG